MPIEQPRLLQRVLPELIALKRNTKSQAIMEAIQLKYHVSANKLSARRVKHGLLGRSVAEFAVSTNSCRLTLQYSLQQIRLSPIVCFVDEETQCFKRVFICPLASSISFGHVRGIVAVDGTFLKGTFVHTLLLAVGVDAEGHIVILAWAIVEGENESSWKWFFSQLKDDM